MIFYYHLSIMYIIEQHRINNKIKLSDAVTAKMAGNAGKVSREGSDKQKSFNNDKLK